MDDWQGKAIVVIALTLAVVSYCQGTRLMNQCDGEIVVNHSGVEECHVGPYKGPLPVEFMTMDTTQEIVL